MKLWRNESEHNHWRALLSTRDRAIGSLAVGGVCLGMAALKLFDPAASCAGSRRWLCSVAQAVAAGLGISLGAAEFALWAGAGLAFAVLGAAYWRAG